MTLKEEIYQKLHLNSQAGLGWRLSQATITPDPACPGWLYYLRLDDEVEAGKLIMALAPLTATTDLRFSIRK